ncbi:MAG TPA: universal stress protein [Gemmatimonadota bacterium]|nr:universal stress protein [Gemmatimonadota bacterium]
MNGPRTILGGIDFGGAGTDAAMWAAMHLDPARVVLGHVVTVPRLSSFLSLQSGTEELIETKLVEDAQARIDVLARELTEDVGLPFETDVRVGVDVAATLDEMADDHDADLLALGPHDRRKGGWNPLGTIPSRLLRATKRPTLIVRGAFGEAPQRVLAAIDDSAVSAHLLDWLAWTTTKLGADGTALHVIDYPLRDFARYITRPAGDDATRFEAQAGEWLRKQLTDAGLDESYDVRVTLGEPEVEILAAARRLDAGLLIMGTRGAGAIGRFLLGTVAQAVVRKAACPVLLLPAKDD